MKSLSLPFLIVLLGATVVAADKKPKDSISVKVVGTLRAGIVAIGGETTGTTITAKGITWELEFGKNAAFRKAAEKLNGKKAVVQGSLERRRGVEIRQRWIVTVTGIRTAGDAAVDGHRKSGFDAPESRVSENATLEAKVGRKSSRVRFLIEDGKTIIDITSEFGIDKATIKRKSNKWPKSILVRLHLGGLESFKAGSDDIAVKWSVSSTGKNAKRVSLRKGKDEVALDKKSPYRTEVRIVGGNGKIPLKNGYFEVPLPAKLFEGNPQEVTLRWIDFFRG